MQVVARFKAYLESTEAEEQEQEQELRAALSANIYYLVRGSS